MPSEPFGDNFRNGDAAYFASHSENRYKENKSNPKKMNGLAARLQAIQEMQQKQLEETRRKQNELNKKKKNNSSYIAIDSIRDCGEIYCTLRHLIA